MSDKQAPNNVVKVDDVEAFELSDEQIERISGGEYVATTDTYICDKCGIETEYLGINHQNVTMFRCPKCGQPYGVW